MYVSETTVKFTGVPFKKTPVVAVNSCPRIPPTRPTLPESRVNLTNGAKPVEKR
jgi:hypothetical protein